MNAECGIRYPQCISTARPLRRADSTVVVSRCVAPTLSEAQLQAAR